MEGNDFWIVDQNHFDEIEKMNDREASRDRFWPVRSDVPNQAFYGFRNFIVIKTITTF